MIANAPLPLLDIESPESDHLQLPDLHSVILPIADPGDVVAFLAHASAELGGGLLWSQPESGMAFAGAGIAESFSFTGTDRFIEASDAVRDLRTRVVRADKEVFPLLGGFAFDETSSRDATWREFPDGRLVVPQVLLQVTPAGSLLRATVPTTAHGAPGDVTTALAALLDRGLEWLSATSMMCVPGHARSSLTPQDRQVWEQQVTHAITAIRAGEMSKVVLARAERLHSEQGISAEAALGCLREEHPGATLFAFAGQESCFIGATPERLVRLREGRVDVTCLAGSAAVGATPEATAELGRHLLSSTKDLREHEIVVESTVDALRTICSDVRRASGTPRLRQARSVQHLETPLFATAQPGTDVLQLAGLLHPTPAVGGFPAAPALQLIRELEPFDRGWYAGPVGWVNLDGSGEFSVAIRSALIEGSNATVYAGCGIVANSDPVAEFTETQLKLRPMLAALGEA